jgi:hypothetical protein
MVLHHQAVRFDSDAIPCHPGAHGGDADQTCKDAAPTKNRVASCTG